MVARDGRSARRVAVDDYRNPLRVSLALLLCFSVAIAGLHTLLNDFGWWFSASFIVLATLGAAAATRVRTANRLMPTLVASLVLLGVLTAMFASEGALLFVLPWLESFETFGQLLASGAATIQSNSAPLAITAGIHFQLSLGLGALAIIADLIAITWRAPALAGVPLLVVLAVPAAVGTRLTDILIFVLAAAGYLMLLRSGRRVPQPGRAVAFGVLAVTLTLLLPLILPPVQESRAATSGVSGYLSGVNPVLNLGADLRRDLPRTMLTYSSRTNDPQYLRLVSLQNFTADTWKPDEVELDTDNTPTLVGAPPGLSSEVLTTNETTWVDVLNLGSPWLPVPYPATRVTGLLGTWLWDADALTFTSQRNIASGENFRVESLAVLPTPSQLASAGQRVPAGFGHFTQLPAELPAIIASTAAEVTAGSEGNYAKAVALQNFFRDGSFGYSETAPEDNGYDGTGMEMIAEFLQAKTGYCVHFASAMAVMARTLDIPSRVAVGFLPGEATDDLVQGRVSYRVTTRNVHAWPELYFDGIGWIRFEPTPGRGFVPSYADEATPGVPVPPVTPTTAPTAEPTVTPTPSSVAAPRDEQIASGGGSTASDAGSWLLAGLLSIAGLGLVLIPAGVRVVQRAVRVRRAHRRWPIATTLWRELLQSAEDVGIRVPPGSTPRQVGTILESAVPLSDAAAQALARLLGLVESQSFAAPDRHTRRQGRPDGPVGDFALVVSAVRGGARLRTRLAAALAPRSIWGLLGAAVRVAAPGRLATGEG